MQHKFPQITQLLEAQLTSRSFSGKAFGVPQGRVNKNVSSLRRGTVCLTHCHLPTTCLKMDILLIVTE